MSEKCLTYKKKLMKMKKERLGLLPCLDDDIMWQIFIRVPAISLFDNCRFVSKQWFNSICSQSFLKAHFLQSKSGVLLIEKLQEKGKKTVEVMKFMEFNEEFGKVHHLHTLKEEEFFISNSAGLCIIGDMKSFSTPRVMNPVTKESTQLPRQLENDLWEQIVFDRANMNYKIAVFSRKIATVERCWLCMLTLHALDGSCMQIQGPNNSWLETPVLINGVLYCNGREEGLWCCDLSIGIFSILRWPINGDYFEISGDGGFLCCVAVADDGEVNIWILRQQKWVHKCCIDKEQPLAGDPGFPPQYIGCLGSEDLFLFTTDGSRLDTYNVKTKQWMMVKPTDNNSCGEMHVSSMLPLTSEMLS